MNQTMLDAIKYFDYKGLKYRVLDEENGIIQMGFDMKNRDPLLVLLLFSSSGLSVTYRAVIMKNTTGDESKALSLCNMLNSKYRWVKIYYNSEEK